MRDLKEQTLLAWRMEGEDWEPSPESDDDEDVDDGLATINMHELGAISREAEARLGCSVEQAALQATPHLHDSLLCRHESGKAMSVDRIAACRCSTRIAGSLNNSMLVEVGKC